MISEKQYADASAKIGCDEAAIKAVTHVEAAGQGFYNDGRIIIKYEGHIFHALTGGKYDAAHPTLSYPKWTEQYTEGGTKAYNRFDQAFALDPKAAMEATSWGMFQIMGENFSSCGYKSVDDFVTDLKKGEAEQLDAFCVYVNTQKLDAYLKNLDWAGFARRYNGSQYAKNHYDTQLAKYYAIYKGN